MVSADTGDDVVHLPAPEPAPYAPDDKPDTLDLKEPPLDQLLSVPMSSKYERAIKLASRTEGRSVAAYIRYLILKDLRSKGLTDDYFIPIGPAVPRSTS